MTAGLADHALMVLQSAPPAADDGGIPAMLLAVFDDKVQSVAVVGGMLFATILGVFLIPVFYVIVAWVSAKLGTLKQAKKKTPVDYM